MGVDLSAFGRPVSRRIVREVLFKAVMSERTAEAHRTVLGELFALRKILLNLPFTVPAEEPVRRDRILAWIEEADNEGRGRCRRRGRRTRPPRLGKRPERTRFPHRPPPYSYSDTERENDAGLAADNGVRRYPRTLPSGRFSKRSSVAALNVR
jgi:hypothetical protein